MKMEGRGNGGEEMKDNQEEERKDAGNRLSIKQDQYIWPALPNFQNAGNNMAALPVLSPKRVSGSFQVGIGQLCNRILVHLRTSGETPRSCDDEDVVMMWWWRCPPLRPQKCLPANVPQSDLKKTMIIQLNWKVGPSMAPGLNWFQSFLSFMQPDRSCDYLLPVRVMLNMFIGSSGGAVLHW